MTTIPTAKPPGWSDMSTADWSGLSVDNWESLPVDGSPDTYTATYDAWNRLVKLVDTSSTDTVAEYEYDARRYRTVVKSYVSGSLDETRHVYYTDSWQAIEERLGTETDPDRQYLWGLRYIDDLILRDRDTNANGTLDERLYALQDGNWNVIAITDENGDVQERYAYTAYGVPMFLSASFGALSSSNYDWETLYCGYRWDARTELYPVRYRYLQPVLGVWLSRDPIRYVDGTNLYAYHLPLITTDPSGTRILKCRCESQGEKASTIFVETNKNNCFEYCCGISKPCCKGVDLPYSEDEKKVEEMCGDDRSCTECLANLMNVINKSRRIGANRCFSYMDQVMDDLQFPINSGFQSICGGKITLVPQTWDPGRFVPTQRGVIYGWYGMRQHAVMQVTIKATGKTSYFDIGSDTHLGQLGGDDHWFFPGAQIRDAKTGVVVPCQIKVYTHGREPNLD